MNTLVIWDYDWSMINENCDTFVVKQLCPDLLPLIGKIAHPPPPEDGSPAEQPPTWTATMGIMMQKMFEAGITAEQIMETQSGVPLLPKMLDAVQVGARANCGMYVVSDANTMYIEAMLQKRGLRSLFKDVISHPAHVDAQGCMRVQQLVPPDKPHGCGLCERHICKGQLVDKLVQESGCERVIYVGDGGGDFCACVALKGPQNIVLARNDEHNTLNRRCKQGQPDKRNWRGDPGLITATVVDWTTGEEVLHTFSSCL
jgi:pyridoxal phosphate phosphatase PHOSPHO2